MLSSFEEEPEETDASIDTGEARDMQLRCLKSNCKDSQPLHAVARPFQVARANMSTALSTSILQFSCQ